MTYVPPDCKWFYDTLRSDIAADDEVYGSDKLISSDNDNNNMMTDN